jgi:putative spermidine/putrescine transport system substrate-binding protein
MNRRSFLIGIGIVSSQLLVGCSNNKTKLTIELLKDSLPVQVVDLFRRSLKSNTEVNIGLVEQFQDVFKKLETWQKPNKPKNDLFGWVRRLPFASKEERIPTDLISLGDYWLQLAIEKKLIQSLDVGKVQQWSALPKRYQELVTRNDKGLIDVQGKIWGAPYRWGNTVIIYRRDKFKENNWAPIQDWADLWRPELRNYVSLLNHPREVIGLVLKKLNKSYNETNLNSINELEPELKKLHQQVKFYSLTQYIEPLLMGDTFAAVGWSQDILPSIYRYSDLAVVVPQSGTAQSADVWVSPRGRQTQQELLTQWINFLWQPEIAEQIALRTYTHSPIPVNIEKSQVQEELRNSLLISQNVLDNSEFLHPLPPEVEKQYIDLFEKVKKS